MAQDAFNDNLPLYMACERKAPSSFIENLVKVYEKAVSTRGRDGSFPLHIAAEKQLDPSVLVTLIRNFPYALDKQNDNMKSPRDFRQKKPLSREALMRPTACWIEDVEKEKYIEAVSRRRLILRGNIVKLRCALTISKEKREKMDMFIKGLQSRIQKQEIHIKSCQAEEKALAMFEAQLRLKMNTFMERITVLNKSLMETRTDEQIMMRSLSKASYMSAIQGNYEKVHLLIREIESEMNWIRSSLSELGLKSTEEESMIPGIEEVPYIY